MTVVYRIDTSQYDPISYGANYLYNEFDSIQSFLNKQNAERYRTILAKPVLTSGSVQWYAHFKNTFTRLNELSPDAQVSIKQKYWEFRLYIDKEIQQLSQSREAQKQEWGRLLKEVFNEDDNIILSDGTDWCLLWGWKFRNNQENYLPPEFMPKPAMKDAVAAPGSINNPSGGGDVPLVTLSAAKDTTDLSAKDASAKRVEPSFWDRIKRFLRTAVYRLWGMMLLIMLILSLMCLFKACHNKRMKERCAELERNNRSLMELQKKVEEKCIEGKK